MKNQLNAPNVFSFKNTSTRPQPAAMATAMTGPNIQFSLHLAASAI